MAKLKRTYIELVKNVDEARKGGEVEIEKVWTPHFIPWKTVRAAMQTLMEMESGEQSEFDMIDTMESVIANDVYAGIITVEDLQERLHAPDAVQTLRGIIEFVSYGHNEKNETRAFLEKNS